jgi:GntR family transcriptional regulator, rspAB operon transcriptional repressor
LQYDDQLTPLKEQVLNEGEVYPVLRRAIVELYLQPGAILSIKDICEHFEIGRSPVRDALIRLDQEGLVTLLPQRGTMISQIDLLRVDQERFLRLSVEEEVMKLFMACHTPSDITLLNEVLRQQQELFDQQDVDVREFLVRDDAFHEVFYAVVDKLFCLRAIQNVWGHYRRMRLLTCGDSTSLQEILHQHSALITSLQARDTELMCNIFHFHLRKLDREELILLKKYPYLFKGGSDYESASPLWKADYLQTLKTSGK